MATVLGIGVAVITKRCGGFTALVFSASRCSTPNRCCSSTTISPKSAKATDSLSKACVPITIPAWPDAARANASLRAAALCEPVSKVTCVAFSTPPNIPPCARGPNNFSIVRRCCAAKTSVGASSAACPPLSMTANIARKATTVLPEPTSPCSKRCIGYGAAISCSISWLTCTCPAVNCQGNAASNALRIPELFAFLEVALSARNCARRSKRSNCIKSASSKVIRSRDFSALSRSTGL